MLFICLLHIFCTLEPILEGKTVIDNINLGVKKSQDILDRFNELSAKCSEPLSDDEMSKVMDELAEVQDKIDAGNDKILIVLIWGILIGVYTT